MRLIYHPRVQHDVTEVLRYYDTVSRPELGDAFFDELCHHAELAQRQPDRFHRVIGGARRVNLKREQRGHIEIRDRHPENSSTTQGAMSGKRDCLESRYDPVGLP